MKQDQDVTTKRETIDTLEKHVDTQGGRGMKIIVEGEVYPVVDDLGYQGGHPVKEVQTESCVRIVFLENGKWQFWTVEDRLLPERLKKTKNPDS